MTTASQLAALYQDAHDAMRNIDGLQPQEAFDELLKYLLFRQVSDAAGQRVGLTRTLNLDGGYRAGGSEAAKAIRRLFSTSFKTHHGAVREVWNDGKFRLTDPALLAIHEALLDVHFAKLSFDVRSTALRMFLGPDLRRGLGIYLTPDDVVRTIVRAAAPPADSIVLDPACGSGTFLIETVRYWREQQPKRARPVTVHGTDINARMVLLADLNLGHRSDIELRCRTMDALAASNEQHLDWPCPNSIDFIFTNPPFGVYVETATVGAQRFSTAGQRAPGARLQSEVLFIEQCLRWLRPGGLLAIVVPRSVMTNDKLAEARRAIDELAYLNGVLALPPETFASTGTQTNTSVLFLRKYDRKKHDHGDVEVPLVEITNVGVDATGRERAGSQLQRAAEDLGASMRTGRATGMARHVRVPKARSLSEFSNTSSRRNAGSSRRKLGDVIHLAQTGRTPARAAYTSAGVFTLKVGNLTGQGIDWSPRERNFADPASVSDNLLLADGDIVLTSSAHNPKYIAQKVDIVHSIPDFAGGRATFVGEVLRLRVKPGLMDPFALLAYLRRPETRAAIQDLVRGQTAHLRPKDLLDLPIEDAAAPRKLIELLREEAELARQMNIVMAGQRMIFASAAPG